MLQDIQLQVSELRKIQQHGSSLSQQSCDQTDSALDKTVVPMHPSESERYLAEAAKKLE